jgi:hypothetical protein
MDKYLITHKDDFDRWGEPSRYRLVMDQVRKTQPGAVRGYRFRAVDGTEYAWVYRNADERQIGDYLSRANREDRQLAAIGEPRGPLPVALLIWTHER